MGGGGERKKKQKREKERKKKKEKRSKQGDLIRIKEKLGKKEITPCRDGSWKWRIFISQLLRMF